MTTTPPRPRRRSLVLLLSFVALAVLGLIAPSVASATPYCGITWGSLDKSSTGGSGGYLDDVRAGQHACYDRLVIDIYGAPSFSSWNVGYVQQVTEDASGKPVPLRGGAFLQIAVHAPDYTPNGTLTYVPANPKELVNVSGFRTFRQVAWAGSSEGYSAIGLGVRARLPFRVFALSGLSGTANGTRVIIDVAHAWQS
jgi:hypothetical protein